MPESGWTRRWRDARNEGDLARAPALPAARDASLSGLVRQGARRLLDVAQADRAGVWLPAESTGFLGTGLVVESDPGPIPEDWKRLDLSSPYLRSALESRNPARVEFIAHEGVRRVPPLAGMRAVVWIPLRADGRSFGLAMVAHAKPPRRLDLDAVQAAADEITRAAVSHRNAARIELASEEMRAHSRLSRAILCGVSTEYVLRQIARTARQYTAAEFVVLGDGPLPRSGVDFWEGPTGGDALLSRESLQQLWQRAFHEGHEFAIEGEELDGLGASLAPIFLPRLARVTAVPIEGRSKTRGVLLAGFSDLADSSQKFAQLESYALLAASTLDREGTRPDRSVSGEMFGQIAAEKERLEAELSGILESIESGVLVLDAEGRILRASDRLATILGIESRRFIDLGTVDDLIDELAPQAHRPAETAARWREHLRRGPEPAWDEFEIERPVRKSVERFSKAIHHAGGAPLGWLQIFRDVTGQRVMQSKLLQTEKMAALGQLVSGIAHELNNPLTSIQGYAQLLLGRRSGADRATDASRISQEAERAARIVKNLLLFSREAKAERRPVRLNEVIERTLALRAYELKLENIEAELVLDPALPPVLADAAQFQQVVLNLLVNAEQAIVMAPQEETPGGHIRIRTERRAGDRLALHVSDDGPGIPAEIVPRIFDPFFTTKPPGVGTGLGLSIVYGIVREHGGEITADSLPGRGATISIELPALAASGLDFAHHETVVERRAAVVPLPLPERVTTKERILVIEDEPTVAELISDVMTDEGYRVDTLLDSREALGRLEGQRYSLVICDLKMPHVDGPGVYRSLIRQDSPMQHRLLFVTGDTMAPRTIEFLKASGLPYLAKPFLVEELKEAVAGALAAMRAGDFPGAEPQRSRVVAWE